LKHGLLGQAEFLTDPVCGKAIEREAPERLPGGWMEIGLDDRHQSVGLGCRDFHAFPTPATLGRLRDREDFLVSLMDRLFLLEPFAR
jgi:hypothetical protein